MTTHLDAAGSRGTTGRSPSRLLPTSWPLRLRLLVAIALVGVTTLVAGAVGVMRMSELDRQAQNVYAEGAVPMDLVRSIQTNWYRGIVGSTRALLPGTSAEFNAAAKQTAVDSVARMEELAAEVNRIGLEGEAADRFAEYEVAVADFLAKQTAIVTAVATGDLVSAGQQLPAFNAAEAATTALLEEATAAQAERTTEIAAEATRAYESARTVLIVVVAIGLLVAALLSLLAARSVTRPVQSMRDVLGRAAAGDLTARVVVTGDDELTAAGHSLNTTLDQLGGVLRLVRDSASGLAEASAVAEATAEAVSENAAQAARQAESIQTAAGEVAMSIDTVSAGSNEMEGAIREIATNATQAADVARRAVDVARTTTDTVGALGESSEQIATVIKVITAIAEQTNLLALNATIEAARAGEMGKGFAVVATEVKELAQETARATEDISGRVQGIQQDTTRAVAAIGEISAVIGEINDFQASIAAAVEEQTATTNEMNRNVAEAASGSRSIADGVSGLAGNASTTHAQVAQARAGSAELARMGVELQRAVAGFSL
ncbi:HAMP domain-containing protein [Modestobacter sp. I12A-02628]|uniref:Methyl-accepting chemotaxis protein n=1 Tax=Goekera deserti TaxID=2497753 RepID=A0A7K3WEW9_9ACTN|nr:methyl-accepting chemotaxis protein [Goekera deserti]MPQ98058.1 HAMP domain-containing protein [Goekera deserti]NDI48705.1 HAMP domain-containing protein [Goekera deserti]NEL54916.1 methyl-accepting chemotaxis protein [Goekera deserti]